MQKDKLNRICEDARKKALNQKILNLIYFLEQQVHSQNKTLSIICEIEKKIIELKSHVDFSGWKAVENYIDGDNIST